MKGHVAQPPAVEQPSPPAQKKKHNKIRDDIMHSKIMRRPFRGYPTGAHEIVVCRSPET